MTSVQIIGFLLLVAMTGAGLNDVVFGRHDRRRARDAEAEVFRLRKRLARLEERRAVRVEEAS
jgi:hypothetical protein